MSIEIDVDFSLLKKAVKAMRAEGLDVLFEKLKKEKGLLVSDLSDVEPINGLLSYKGYQIILYIQDHTLRDRFEAKKDGNKRNKFHLTECQTIQKMRRENRLERYVITNNQSGNFLIRGENDKKEKAELQVCKNCLEKLNYADYRNTDSDKDKIVQEFHIPIFFETYASCFSTLPSRRSGVEEDYTDNWGKVSRDYRESRNFTCEICRVDLSQPDHHKLLHTHHRNGRKRENEEKNLQALCAYCHSTQDHHGHMKTGIFRESFEQIKKLRQEQEKLRQEQGLDQPDPPQEELF